MRYASKRKMRLALPALAAAGFCAWMGVPSAHGDLVITLKNGPAGTNVAGGVDYVLQGFNNGLNGTGTSLLALDVTLKTTTGDLIIQTTADTDGDGNPDANINGQLDQSNGQPTPTLGGANGGAGTFVGLPTATTGTKVASTFGIVHVEENGNLANFQSGSGTVNQDFFNGTVSTLRVVGAFTGSFKGPNASVTPVAFANIVVPAGVVVTAFGAASGNIGASQPFSIVFPSVTTSGPLIQLAGTALAGTTSLGTITMSGSNGNYVAQTVAVSGPASTAGALTVNGFNPTNDKEIYLLTATSANISGLIASLNTAVAAADPGASAIVPTGSAATLAPSANIEVIFPNNGVAAPNIFSYNLAPTDGSISSITVVPEPTSIGGLVLGGLGLLGRRRKRRMA